MAETVISLEKMSSRKAIGESCYNRMLCFFSIKYLENSLSERCEELIKLQQDVIKNINNIIERL